jgi:hypothetical protein
MKLITSAHVLVLPNNNLLFRLEANGSGIATGVVLSQQSVECKRGSGLVNGSIYEIINIFAM